MNIMIVGAAGGVGHLLAKHFDTPLHHLYLVGHKEKVHIPYNGQAIYTDFTSEKNVEAVFSRIKTLNLLINAQGVTADNLIKNMGKSEWDMVLDVNLTSVFLACKHAYFKMKPLSHIINFSSVLAKTGMIGASNYAASKGAIESFTKSFALEAIRNAVFVNCISLGYFDIGMGRRLSDKITRSVERKIPLGYFGHKDEILKLVEYIIQSTYLVGQTIELNGGLT